MDLSNACEGVIRLLERQERERDELQRKILAMERELNEKQKSEREFVKSQVINLGCADVQEKMEQMADQLNEKADNEQFLESMNQALISKERQSNDELQNARKRLIQIVGDLDARTDIGIKRLGELDVNPFLNACKKRYSAQKAPVQAGMLCSTWQEQLSNINWHPFKIINPKGNAQEVLDIEDEKLKKLKGKWGDEVFNAVVTALKELNEYDPSGRCIVQELWNYKEKRKATLEEGIACVEKSMKSLKRKRTETCDLGSPSFAVFSWT